MYLSAGGGTGYLADNSGTRETMRGRLQTAVIDHAPDVVLVAGGLNDWAVYTGAAIAAEAALLYAEISGGAA